MPQSLSAVHVHAIFSTKGRRSFLASPDLRRELHGYVGAVSGRLDCPAKRIGGTDDHVHVLAALGRTVSVADWIMEIKRVSTRWLKSRDPVLDEFAWQNGYGALSVSASNLDRVAAYVADQERHHQKFDYRREPEGLLQRHRLAWDEKHLWD